MKSVFGTGCPVKASLRVEFADGSVQNVAFKYVKSVDLQHSLAPEYCSDLWPGVTDRPSNPEATLKIFGGIDHNASFVDASKVKKSKPEPEPRKPSLRSAADRLRKANSKYRRINKQIEEAEAALEKAQDEKGKLNAELTAARLQLLASAS